MNALLACALSFAASSLSSSDTIVSRSVRDSSWGDGTDEGGVDAEETGDAGTEDDSSLIIFETSNG